MMQDKINEELKNAMKARDELVVSTLRMLNSEIKNAQIENKADLSDEEVLKVIEKEAKKRKDAIEAYDRAGVADKADREKQELALLQAYLPEQLPLEEVERLVDEAFAKTGAKTMADMKLVMNEVMSKASGRIDAGVVAGLVKQKLQ